MRPLLSRALRRLVPLALLLAAGCTATPPPIFYTLSPQSDPAARVGAPADSEVSVAIGDIVIPDYLDRPQVVVRSGDNTMTLAENHVWVEPLRTLIARTMVYDLGSMLGSRNIYILPQRRPVDLDYIVEVEIGRFETDAAGRALLDSRWRLYGSSGDRLIEQGIVTETTSVEAPLTYENRVAALSDTITSLSRTIAAAIARTRT